MSKKFAKYDSEIIKKYNEGLSCKAISDLFNNEFSSTYVRNLLKRNNIELRTKGGRNKIDTSEIIRLYTEEKLSLQEIANRTGRKSLESIRQLLLNANVTMRNRASKKDWNLNESYFNEINSEFKAYILGYLIADGNVYERKDSNPCIRMEIHEKDKYILEIFKKELNSDNKIRYGNSEKRKHHVTFSVHSEEIFNDLSKYGIVPNKTFKTYLPTNIDKSLMRHLIRGLMDGDGWVAKKDAFIGFIGTEQLMDDVKNYLKEELDIDGILVEKDENTHITELWFANKKDKKILYEYLYKESNYYLTRKFNNLESYLKKVGLLE